MGLGGGTTAFLGTFINFNILGLKVNWVWVDGGLGVEPSGAVSGEAAPATEHSAYHNTQMFPSISGFHNFQSVLCPKFLITLNTRRITTLKCLRPFQVSITFN